MLDLAAGRLIGQEGRLYLAAGGSWVGRHAVPGCRRLDLAAGDRIWLREAGSSCRKVFGQEGRLYLAAGRYI